MFIFYIKKYKIIIELKIMRERKNIRLYRLESILSFTITRYEMNFKAKKSCAFYGKNKEIYVFIRFSKHYNIRENDSDSLVKKV